MEKELFHTLYKHVRERDVKDFPSNALSGLLHGYLSVYSMVRVYPWLEDEFDSPWDIHERVREIARAIQLLLKDHDIPVDERAGHVVDLMDTYLLYSDVGSLEIALDAAYEILIPQGSDKIVLPCRTPNICRLLCNCYYFMGEEECGILAKGLVTEAFGLIRRGEEQELVRWWWAIKTFENIVDIMQLSRKDQEWFSCERDRLVVSVTKLEEEKIENRENTNEPYLLAKAFEIMAKQEFAVYNDCYSMQ